MILFSNMERCGFLPEFLSPLDPRGAVDQLHANYAHGGGWSDFNGFTLHGWEAGKDDRKLPQNHAGDSRTRFHLTYPGEFGLTETYLEVGRGFLRSETISLFEGEWVAVIQPDGSFRVSRMD